MARPTDAGNFAEAVYAQLEPLTYDEANQDYALLKYVGALGQLFEQVDNLARSDGDHMPWSKLLDIDEIPDIGIPYLAQFVGTVVEGRLPMSEQRQQVRDRKGWARGRVNTLVEAIRPYLSGTGNIQVRERSPDAYNFQLAVFTSQSPHDQTLQNIYDDYATLKDLYVAWSTLRKIWELSGPNLLNSILDNIKPAADIARVIVRSFQDLYDVWLNRVSLQEIYNVYPTLYDLYIGGAIEMGSVPTSIYHSFDTLWEIYNDYQTLENLYVSYQEL